MTTDELRALDARVHREVMGHTIPEVCPMCNGTGKGEGHGAGLTCWACSVGTPVVPAYSSDIAAAWRVVERLQQDGYSIRLSNKTMNWCWWCYIIGEETESVVQESTAPEAICLAALKAVGHLAPVRTGGDS